MKGLKWGLTGCFLAVGLLTLAAYMKIGYEHRARVGERYAPAHFQPHGASSQRP
jgi:fumarate reductase subunit C